MLICNVPMSATNTMRIKERTYLLDKLWELQNARGYVSDEDIVQAASEFGISPLDVEVVSGFYKF